MSFLHRAEIVNGIGTDWTHLGARAHAVQFYEHDDALADLLAGYVGTAVVKGDAAIVIATEKHRHDLWTNLAGRGLDLTVAKYQGRYQALDADETLGLFCATNGWPDAQRFHRVLGDVIERASNSVASPRPRAVAFGEIVALLCGKGQYAAAVRLEELWNELAQTYSFSLCCAYPMGLFKSDDVAAARFMKVCAQHSHVFPAERRNVVNRTRAAFG